MICMIYYNDFTMKFLAFYSCISVTFELQSNFLHQFFFINVQNKTKPGTLEVCF